MFKILNVHLNFFSKYAHFLKIVFFNVVWCWLLKAVCLVRVDLALAQLSNTSPFVLFKLNTPDEYLIQSCDKTPSKLILRWENDHSVKPFSLYSAAME